MNEPLAYGPVIAILAMAAATYLTRISGYWLMGHIPMTQRVRPLPASRPTASWVFDFIQSFDPQR